MVASAGCVGQNSSTAQTGSQGPPTSSAEKGAGSDITQGDQTSQTSSTQSQTTSSSSSETSTTPRGTSTKTESREITVTFIVSVPGYTPPEDDAVYIAGDFNGWNPGDENYRLTKLPPDGRWAINLTFPPYGKVIEFKFTRGSWETVEKAQTGRKSPPTGSCIQR